MSRPLAVRSVHNGGGPQSRSSCRQLFSPGRYRTSCLPRPSPPYLHWSRTEGATPSCPCRLAARRARGCQLPAADAPPCHRAGRSTRGSGRAVQVSYTYPCWAVMARESCTRPARVQPTSPTGRQRLPAPLPPMSMSYLSTCGHILYLPIYGVPTYSYLPTRVDTYSRY